MREWKRRCDGQQKKSRELEKEQESISLQHGGHSGLHRTGSIPANRLRTSLRLLVAGRYHVRDAHRYAHRSSSFAKGDTLCLLSQKSLIFHYHVRDEDKMGEKSIKGSEILSKYM